MIQYKNVYLICNFAAEYGGNFLASLLTLASELENAGTKCCFLLPNSAKDKPWIKSISEEIRFCDFSIFCMIKALTSYLKNDCLIYTHFIDAHQMIAIKFASKKFHSKIAYHMHNRYGLKDNKLRRLVKRYIYKNVVFIGVSTAVYNDLCSVFDKKNCFCVPNSIAIERLKKTEDVPMVLDKNQALILGSHYFRKGVDLAVRAFEQISKRSAMHLIVVAHNVEATKAAIAKDGNTNNISVIPPVIDVERLYRSSNIFLAPARLEPFGYAVVEAAYCGCTVIASDIPGQNTLKDIPGIIWIMPNSVEALVEGIDTALMRETADSDNAKKIIEQKYSMDAWCKGVLKVFDANWIATEDL